MAPPSSEIYTNSSSNNVQDYSLQKEKQISIDPISVREMLPNIITTPKPNSNGVLLELPPSLVLAKPKFLSHSLPNSANSSPRFGSSLLKKKAKNETQLGASPLQYESNSTKQVNLPLEYFLRRSKSYGEGRGLPPSDDFDLWPIKSDFSPPRNEDHYQIMMNNKVNHQNDMSSSDEGFKCGALCLFLPGLMGKAKPVRAGRKGEAKTNGNSDHHVVMDNYNNVISRTVSLEKFECGSWASSALGDEANSSRNLYFDLPMELIRSSDNDANSPVTSAFLFEKDRKGVLKNGSLVAARKSHESSRHVRFSTNSPTSYPASPASFITPRLRKAREDFNAFLEAQSA
ncbi:hypothetical protein UlMin_020088 [Ulmus minor]